MMRRLVVSVVATAALLFLFLTTRATAETSTTSLSYFQEADKNGDGVLTADEFEAAFAGRVLSSDKMVPARIADDEVEPTYFLQTQQIEDEERRRMAGRTSKGHPGGCYRVCPSPVVFRSGEPFGGPYGPDPYYTYGQNHMY